MTTTEVLVQARALIQKRENWTRHAYARDKYSHEVMPTSDEACRWCAIGALSAVVGTPDPSGSPKVLDVASALATDLPAQGERPLEVIVKINDQGIKAHADVLAAFDKAIQMSKEQG